MIFQEHHHAQPAAMIGHLAQHFDGGLAVHLFASTAVDVEAHRCAAQHAGLFKPDLAFGHGLRPVIGIGGIKARHVLHFDAHHLHADGIGSGADCAAFGETVPGRAELLIPKLDPADAERLFHMGGQGSV